MSVWESCAIPRGGNAGTEAPPRASAPAGEKLGSLGTRQGECHEFTRQGKAPSPLWGPPNAGLESQTALEDSFLSHHHWLLV